MKNAHLRLLVAALLLASVGAVGGQDGGGTRNSDVRLAAAPAGVAALQNPYEGQPEAIQAGKKLFRRHCAECHGPEGHGQGKAPDLRSATVQNFPPGVLFWFLKNGNLREGMPSWSRLPDQRLWQLVAYLKTLR
jgi:mono/diheme cytochrome c family protein